MKPKMQRRARRSGWDWQSASMPCGGAPALVALQPWPEYGERGAAWWPVVVQTSSRLYRLAWSTHLARWARSGEPARMRRDLTPEQLREVEFHVRNRLEGSLA